VSDARRFPVLRQMSKAVMPKTVPWAFAETLRAQAANNHGQTLERLAERGGLGPEEMYAAAHGWKWGRIGNVTEADAIAWLVEAVKPYEDSPR